MFRNNNSRYQGFRNCITYELSGAYDEHGKDKGETAQDQEGHFQMASGTLLGLCTYDTRQGRF